MGRTRQGGHAGCVGCHCQAGVAARRSSRLAATGRGRQTPPAVPESPGLPASWSPSLHESCGGSPEQTDLPSNSPTIHTQSPSLVFSSSRCPLPSKQLPRPPFLLPLPPLTHLSSPASPSAVPSKFPLLLSLFLILVNWCWSSLLALKTLSSRFWLIFLFSPSGYSSPPIESLQYSFLYRPPVSLAKLVVSPLDLFTCDFVSNNIYL